jgi:hypothetical protein
MTGTRPPKAEDLTSAEAMLAVALVAGVEFLPSDQRVSRTSELLPKKGLLGGQLCSQRN